VTGAVVVRTQTRYVARRTVWTPHPTNVRSGFVRIAQCVKLPCHWRTASLTGSGLLFQAMTSAVLGTRPLCEKSALTSTARRWASSISPASMVLGIPVVVTSRARSRATMRSL
jgi:hypothetical protein